MPFSARNEKLTDILLKLLNKTIEKNPVAIVMHACQWIDNSSWAFLKQASSILLPVRAFVCACVRAYVRGNGALAYSPDHATPRRLFL